MQPRSGIGASPSGTNPTLILAGSIEEARHYAKKLRLAVNEWRYVSPDVARGRREPTVYVVGTWYARPDLHEIRLALAPCRPMYLNEDGNETTPMNDGQPDCPDEYVAELERKVERLTERVGMFERRLAATVHIAARQATQDVTDRLMKALRDA